MNLLQTLVGFLGRALLSLIFISSGIFKLFDWQGTMQHFTQALADWVVLGVGHDALRPLLDWGLVNASLLLSIGVAFELIGGMMVFLGLWVRLGAVLIILFLIPATVVFHHFWQLQGPDRTLQMIMFMKNLSILGGLLLLLAYGRGCKSGKVHEQSSKKD
jgi:putative oxidoreductase